MKTKNFIAFIGFIALSQAAGVVGALFTTPAINGWYITLARPPLSPPNWVFAPVWLSLYTLMGIAAFLVWRKRHEDARVGHALGTFYLQLVLNALWSIIFFGLHSLGGALIGIVCLLAAILATIVAFKRISTPTFWLLLPYLLWVSFATYLNYGFWVGNR